jgi:hypothetical protein
MPRMNEIPTDQLATADYINNLEMRILVSTVLMVISAYLSFIFLLYQFIPIFADPFSPLSLTTLVLFPLFGYISIYCSSSRYRLKKERDFLEYQQDLDNMLNEDTEAEVSPMDLRGLREPNYIDAIGFPNDEDHRGERIETLQNEIDRIWEEREVREGPSRDEDRIKMLTTTKHLLYALIIIFSVLVVPLSIFSVIYFNISRFRSFILLFSIALVDIILTLALIYTYNVEHRALEINTRNNNSSNEPVASIPSFPMRDKEVLEEFKINKYLTLKLEKKYGQKMTNIYVAGAEFMQCKYLLLDIPENETEKTWEIQNIDEAAEVYSRNNEFDKSIIDPETEFFGHCSNLEAWAENDYNTDLLHRNLAFPLLKKLTEAGDPKARKVFKEEIARRIIKGDKKGREYLLKQRYLQYLSPEEIETIYKEVTSENYLYTIKKKIEKKLDERPPNRGDINILTDIPHIILKAIYPDLKIINTIDDLNTIEKGDFLYLSEKLINQSEYYPKILNQIETFIMKARHYELVIFFRRKPTPLTIPSFTYISFFH